MIQLLLAKYSFLIQEFVRKFSLGINQAVKYFLKNFQSVMSNSPLLFAHFYIQSITMQLNVGPNSTVHVVTSEKFFGCIKL